MKTLYFIAFAFILLAGSSSAQTFESIDTLRFTGLTNLEGEFADLNNDGSLEILVFGFQDSTDTVFPLVLTYRDEMWKIDTLSIDTLASTKYLLSDINDDNKLDIAGIINQDSINYLAVFYQTGDFEFDNYAIIDSLYTPFFQVEDLNNDGSKELIYSSSDSSGYNLKILSQNSGSWKEDTTIASVPYGPQLVFDFDNNKFRDIYIAGADSTEQAFSMLISNNNDTLTTSDSIFLQLKNPQLTLGDYNHDGFADILGAGVGTDSLFHTYLLVSGTDSTNLEYLSFDTLGIVKNADHFMADFNSDGLTDLILKGVNRKDSIVNILLLSTADSTYISEQLDTMFALGTIQRFADLDYDGDLDKVILSPGIDTFGSQLILYNNITPAENTAPGLPIKFAAFQVENNILLFWEDVPDDHTAEPALTYDVLVTDHSSAEGVMLPSFDLATRKRYIVKHGNNGYNNKITVKNLPSGVYDYGVQAIDNSFHHAAYCEGTFVYCQTLGNEEIVACIGETVKLRAKNENTGWYSLSEGFLGFSRSVSIKVTGSDTIYNDASGDIPCFERRRWIITPEKVKLEFEDVLACENELLKFRLAEVHDSVQWISSTKGLLSDTSIMEVTAQKADTIRVEVYKSGCIFSDTFSITIDTPKISLNGSHFKIFAGQEVQLEASGVERYTWSPKEGLNDSTIANPIASPLKNTTYTVTGINSLGCVTKDSISVVVEHAAFVATLFTPNNDSKNDALLLFGLEQATDFSFQLYNRSGTLIYKTEDVHEATTSGWDGTVNGKPQPNGVYYWKVAGAFPDGKKVLLNQKESGAIHLIR